MAPPGSSAGAVHVVVLAPTLGRLDVAVLAALHQRGVTVTRSALGRAFVAGQVCAQGRALRASSTVVPGVTIEVELALPVPLRAEPESVPLTIVFEDDALLVIDKPAGMPVHAGPGHSHGTLVNAVLGYLQLEPDALPVLAGNDATRPGIVHRLDKNTSGLLVVAKHAAAQEHLAAQFRRHDLERSYLGIVDSVPRWTETTLDTLHGRDPAERRRFSPDVPHGRRAITHARVEQALHAAALVRFTLKTGRTHQIRMHARKLGHPIVGDVLYGHAPADARAKAAVAVLERHALHADTLGLVHPDGRKLRWQSPLPLELARLVEALTDP